MGISEKRLLGWEPTERHDHYDDADRLQGYTIITREAEWDDGQRDRLLALMEHNRNVCACGFHTSLTRDPSNQFEFEVKRCSVCAGMAQMERQQAEQDKTELERRGDNVPPRVPRPSDGRTTLMKLVPQQAPGEQAQPTE